MFSIENFFLSVNCIMFWDLSYNSWMFGVGSDVFLIEHTLCWPSMHCISLMLKPKLCIDTWWGGDTLHTCFLLNTLENLGKHFVQTTRTWHYCVTECPVQTEVRIHSVFGDIIKNLNSTLYWSLLQEWQPEESTERQDQAIEHSFKGHTPLGIRRNHRHEQFVLCLWLLPWCVVCLLINFLTH